MPSRIRFQDGRFTLVEDPFTAISDDWAIPQGDLVELLALLIDAQDADVAHVVVAAGVDAAADLDLQLADQFGARGSARES